MAILCYLQVPDKAAGAAAVWAAVSPSWEVWGLLLPAAAAGLPQGDAESGGGGAHLPAHRPRL